MRAIVLNGFGDRESLSIVEVPTPRPGTGEVVVRVAAAGVCYHDVLERAGKIPGASVGRILGHEVSGDVFEIGAGVANVSLGQHVVLYNRLPCHDCRYCLAGRHDLCRRSTILGSGVDGGYAEYVCVPASGVIPVPEGVSLADAALACCPVGTSVRAVIGIADVRPGDKVLVTGASGGLGLHQIQIAKAMGGHVIAVTSSAAKVETIQELGADEVIVRSDVGYAGDVWRMTGKSGVEVVLENVTTGMLQESLRCLAPHGIAVVLGNIGIEQVSLDPGLVISRRLRIQGSGNPTYADVERALQLIATRRVRPWVAETLGFQDVVRAHAILEDRRTLGRVVLQGWS